MDIRIHTRTDIQPVTPVAQISRIFRLTAGLPVLVCILAALTLPGCSQNYTPGPSTNTVTALESLEFGHTPGSNDYCAPMLLPPDFGRGFLFSVWTKVPDDLSSPVLNTLNRGNMIVLEIRASNWNILALVGNIYIFGDGRASYNANYMLGAGGVWADDWCTYQTLEYQSLPVTTVSGWVWVAWQVVLETNGSMTFRQWLKFGPDGAVFAAGHYVRSPDGVETATVEYVRDFITNPSNNYGNTADPAFAASWLPGPFESFQVGWDNSYSGVGDHGESYLCHARLEARVSAPALAELEAMASRAGPDPTAWGDWELNWVAGAADLTDRSGNGRHLVTAPGGALYKGPAGPAFR